MLSPTGSVFYTTTYRCNVSLQFDFIITKNTDHNSLTSTFKSIIYTKFPDTHLSFKVLRHLPAYDRDFTCQLEITMVS